MKLRQYWRELDDDSRRQIKKYSALVIVALVVALGGRMAFVSLWANLQDVQNAKVSINESYEKPLLKSEVESPDYVPPEVSNVQVDLTSPAYAQRITISEEVTVYELPDETKATSTVLPPNSLVDVTGDIRLMGSTDRWVQVSYFQEGGRQTGYLREADTMPYLEGMEELVQNDLTSAG